MDHKCPGCSKVVAKEDMRFTAQRKVKSMQGATLILEEGNAPKVRCRCGRILILLRGSF